MWIFSQHSTHFSDKWLSMIMQLHTTFTMFMNTNNVEWSTNIIVLSEHPPDTRPQRSTSYSQNYYTSGLLKHSQPRTCTLNQVKRAKASAFLTLSKNSQKWIWHQSIHNPTQNEAANMTARTYTQNTNGWRSTSNMPTLHYKIFMWMPVCILQKLQEEAQREASGDFIVHSLFWRSLVNNNK